MAFLKNNLAAVKIGLNAFFAVVSGYFLLASNLFKVNPWYLVILYTIISAAILLGLWLVMRIIYRKTHDAIKGSPGMIKKMPNAMTSKHQIKGRSKTPARKGRK
jgi:membrane protein implicated in regulation of membrane protease activity